MKFDDSIDDELKGWLRLDNWTPREAFLLLCGANPRFDGYPLRPLQCRAEIFDPSEAFDCCEKLEESWRRGSHNLNSNSPAYYIEWAQAHGFGVWWLDEIPHDEQDKEASVTAQPSDVATDNVPLIIRGDTMELIHRAVNAFPTRYAPTPFKSDARRFEIFPRPCHKWSRTDLRTTEPRKRGGDHSSEIHCETGDRHET